MAYYKNKIYSSSFIRRFWFYLKFIKIDTFWSIFLLVALASFWVFFISWQAEKVKYIEPKVVIVTRKIIPAKEIEIEVPKTKFKFMYQPVPIDMEKVKYQGCVADGILSGYGNDTKEAVKMVNRSECTYLHRALETWGRPPDFDKASEIMEKIDKPGIVYGMFIAEAIRRGDREVGPSEKEFDFTKMCREGTDEAYGYKTCIPELESLEYRKYLKSITQDAMDLGIQSFLFGQIYYQEGSDINKSKMFSIVKEMRSYAKEKGMEIIVGAQTGSITNKRYLEMFDYIEGGIGMGEDGWVENGACWSFKESCWALLWHDNYFKKANNILVHLDWSGLSFDDMSVFARMDKDKRKTVLERLHLYFKEKRVGFLLPLMATIHKNNSGCYGPKKGFYSASNKYSCQDEDAINRILKESK